MRSRPAHISRDKASTAAGALPPPTTKARKQRAFRPCRLDKPHSISAVRGYHRSSARPSARPDELRLSALGKRNLHDVKVAGHLAGIFENWPDLTFRGRRMYVRDGLVVNEWSASATDKDGRRLEWDGVDIFPFEDGLITRKDVYSSSHRPRVVDS